MLVRNKCIRLEEMAIKWSDSTETLASIATSTVKSVKEQEDLVFWKDCKLDEKLDIYQDTEPVMQVKREPVSTENLPGTSRDPPPRFGLVPGTQILWDFVNNEPVDMVIYENPEPVVQVKKKPVSAENLPGSSRRDPSPRFSLVPGTQILWDSVNNEPVDMVIYEN